ncbi:trafficking protein particle complex subunit 12 [Anaeramoeba flamelloides]|uniref:Trafficking protein particle complex subunit 12 n=1 Tax=Anaeramoeba flamelloides TaxID=1746091 RepID=A0ABQ8XTQ6_9EUKA|nr:trafficking protein particle complex subunit 12 [Anaeramoeba flamelloides]
MTNFLGKRTTNQNIYKKIVEETEQQTIKRLLEDFFSPMKCPELPVIININHVSKDEEGLLKLAIDKSWKNVAELSKFLSEKFKDSPEDYLHYQLCQLQALRKIKNYSEIENVINEIGDLNLPIYKFENYKKRFHNKKGSLVPFSLRVFYAESHHFLGNTQKTITQLYYLHTKCVRELNLCKKYQLEMTQKNSNINNNLNRPSIFKENLENELSFNFIPPITSTKYHFTNSINSNNLRLVFDGVEIDDFQFNNLDELFEKQFILQQREQWILFSLTNYHLYDQNYELVSKHLFELYSKYPKDPVLLSMIGRIHLKMSDLNSAQKMFKGVEDITGLTSFYSLRNGAFYNIFTENYEEALEILKELCERDPDDLVSINNLAIVHFYLSNIDKAIQLIENTIKKNPKDNIQYNLIKNLLMFYEIGAKDPENKKKILKTVISQYNNTFFERYNID